MKKFILVLSAFTLLFTLAYAGGKATATWTAPTTYTDGTPIASGDLKEFRIYQGSASGTYTTFYTVPATTNRYVVTASTGTYFFALTAVTKEGAESDYSNELSRYFPPQKPSSCIFSWQ